MNKKSIDFIVTYNIVLERFFEEDATVKDVILGKDDFISSTVLSDIFRYCDRHGKVYIENFDDMKIIYFLGILLSEISKDNRFFEIAISILDRLVYVETGKFLNKRIQTKIINSIKTNDWRYIFGIDGIYTIYKACHRNNKVDI